jgi:hypothetical protein
MLLYPEVVDPLKFVRIVELHCVIGTVDDRSMEILWDWGK